MPIGRLDHYSIRPLDIEASRRFYTEIMGFRAGYRPEFNFPGLWLYNDRPGCTRCSSRTRARSPSS